MGADVIGGIPHNEGTPEDGVASLRIIFDLAEKYGVPIDVHCDERGGGGAPAVGGLLRTPLLRPLARVPARPGLPYRTAGGGDTWAGTTWFIEADISDCFGSFDHDIMIAILSEKIHDGRFLRPMRHMLQAGYLQD